jgi:hypothetical protein
MRRRVRHPLALAWLLYVASACHLMVDGEIESYSCAEEEQTGPPACPVGLTCRAGTCVAVAAVPKLGDPCTADDGCSEADLCVGAELVGAAGAAGMCSRPCCTSADCGPPNEGFVCATTGDGGASFCRRAADLGLGPLGPALAGDSCAVSKECRSGRCEGSLCRDACCSDTNCASGDAICRVEGQAWQCGAAGAGARPYLELCGVDGDCASGLCLAMGPELRCSMPCCESAVCGSTVIGGVPSQIACREIERNGSWIRACGAVVPSTASGLVGVACGGDAECRSGLCALEGGPACTDVCCADADCGDEQAFSCLPTYEAPGGTWVLRCVAK